MEQTIDLNKSVFDLVKAYPEVTEVMKQLGFVDIIKPGMLNTAGRFMTIPKGAALKGIDMDKIKQTFKDRGFKVLE